MRLPRRGGFRADPSIESEYAGAVDLELTPEQPSEVVRAVAALLPSAERPVDSWWREGLEETLYGDATALPRNTLGADLA
jgi:hypothetical protein